MKQTIAITGAFGFIGSHFVSRIYNRTMNYVLIDKMGVGSDINNISEDIRNADNVSIVTADLCNISIDDVTIGEVSAIVHFAAESHVDRSIATPVPFVMNNIGAILPLLEYCKDHRKCMLFNVSTDEVYGSLQEADAPWDDSSPLQPRSPYSVSKATCDMLCRAYAETYKVNSITTRCSNNFGPRQGDEKFIPTIIRSIVNGVPIPVYGVGNNKREWIPVQKHAEVIIDMLYKHMGQRITGPSAAEFCIQTNISIGYEMSNMSIIHMIADNMQKRGYEVTMKFVEDRKGHDFRYAMKPTHVISYDFNKLLDETINFYIDKYTLNSFDEQI